MKQLRNNIIANFLGQGWSGLMSVVFVPVYIALLGIESYGLIGLYVSMQALFYILDSGMSATLNREMARHAHAQESAARSRDLARTLEWLYWPIGLAIFALTFAGSGPLALHWLHPVQLSPGRVAHAVALMGLSIALQWPSTLYAGGFRGLERQVALNGLNAVFVTLRSAGAVAVLYFYAATIEAFLWWQVAVSAAQTSTMAIGFWRLLPGDGRPATFRRERLAEVAHFAAGMAGIAVLSFLLSYSDRLILSKVLPLDQFGYYALAATAAAVLAPVVQAFFNALYPRFSNMVVAHDEAAVARLYHASSQLLAVVVASVAAVLALFARDALYLWSRDAVLAANSAPILALLVTGIALNGLVTLPYALQLAHGWTRLALYQNTIAVALMLPASWWLAHHVGGRGVAAAWLVLNAGFLFITVPLMHRRLLRGELARWFLRDLLPPVAAAVSVAGAARLALPVLPDKLAGILVLAAISAATLLAAALCSPVARGVLRGRSAFPLEAT